MKSLLDRIHDKIGDLWWYSLMIFVACRSGDVIQAFIGLWLVPKYIGPDELGAVLPLQQLSGLFAAPLAIIATVFSKYVNTYATRGEYGKVKSFIHDVLLASIGTFLFCIIVAYLVIPHFYERLNVSAGLLTVLILAAGFANNIANLFTSALQGLKKFKTMTIQNLISAPIRLATLLVTMPIRALSGYILGQTTPAATCGLLAAFTIRKDLKDIQADTSWRNDIPEIWHYLIPIAIYSGIAMLCAAIQSTVYRQRLPEIESSAYYLLSRFSEIAGYLGGAIMFVLVPLASEAHEKGQDNTRLLHRSIQGTVAVTITLSVIFFLSAEPILNVNSTWSPYSEYANLLSWMTINTGIGIILSTICSYEMACRRFKKVAFVGAMNLTWTIFLVCTTGYSFFYGKAPTFIVEQIKNINMSNLSTIVKYGVWFGLIQLLILFFWERCAIKSRH